MPFDVFLNTREEEANANRQKPVYINRQKSVYFVPAKEHRCQQKSHCCDAVFEYKGKTVA